MKTIIKSLAFTFMILATVNFAAVAGGGNKKGKKAKAKKDIQFPYKAVINQHRGNTVAIQFQKPSADKVSITIQDENGKTLRYETVKKHNLVVKKYVLDKFPAGSYKVIVSNGSEVITQKVTVTKPNN